MNTDSLGFGLGLRSPHYEHFLDKRPTSVDWLEIISENYIQSHEGYWHMLADLRQDYPFVMHGVSLSIGSTDSLDDAYLTSLRQLADHIDVAWFSDHLCFTAIQHENTHDLLPIPYTEEALSHLIPRIHHVQEKMKRPLILENASAYLEFNGSTLSEPELLTELHKRTGCGILLDINNVYVSSFNHGWDAYAYIDAIPETAIQQYHLAGHSNKGTHLIDTHDDHVTNEVWKLYEYTLKSKGKRSTMVEWDANIPEFDVLEAELSKAKAITVETP